MYHITFILNSHRTFQASLKLYRPITLAMKIAKSWRVKTTTIIMINGLMIIILRRQLWVMGHVPHRLPATKYL